MLSPIPFHLYPCFHLYPFTDTLTLLLETPSDYCSQCVFFVRCLALFPIKSMLHPRNCAGLLWRRRTTFQSCFFLWAFVSFSFSFFFLPLGSARLLISCVVVGPPCRAYYCYFSLSSLCWSVHWTVHWTYREADRTSKQHSLPFGVRSVPWARVCFVSLFFFFFSFFFPLCIPFLPWKFFFFFPGLHIHVRTTAMFLV